MNKTLKNERGVALLWTLITVLVLLVITGSMADLIVKESRMSVGIDGSLKAYAAAESGIERGSYLASIKAPAQTLSNQLVDLEDDNDPTTYTLTLKGTPGNYTVESEGKNGKVRRKIKKVITTTSQPSVGSYQNSVTLDSASGGFRTHNLSGFAGSDINTVTQSYRQNFTFETATDIAAGQSIAMGFSNNYTTANAVLAEITDTKLKIQVGFRTPMEVDFNIEPLKKYKLSLEYKKGLVAMATISELGVDADSREIATCKQKITDIPTSPSNISTTFNKVLYYYKTGGVPTGTAISQAVPQLNLGTIAKVYAVSIKTY